MEYTRKRYLSKDSFENHKESSFYSTDDEEYSMEEYSKEE